MSTTTPEQITMEGVDAASGPAECLGLRFESDQARRAYFQEKLREKLKDPEFRKIEGFPHGSDEDILRLSDPPYYTACPNPFLEDFIRCYGKPFDPSVPYERKPFAVDVSEGKTDPIYTAHSYHTKVPHKAIMRAILHYTEPGDIILDGFAGSGMTGVAAQMCAHPEPAFKKQIEDEWKAAGQPPPKWGARRAILGDLSPAATFIAANYNLPFDVEAFQKEARRILDELRDEIGWMYETTHKDGRKGFINYTVWSEVFSCPTCSGEVVFTAAALDEATQRVADVVACPHCGAEARKEQMQLLFETFVDPASGAPGRRPKRVPVLIHYTAGQQKHSKTPDVEDLRVLKRLSDLPLPEAVPTDRLPDCQMTRVGLMQTTRSTAVHRMYLPRAAQAIGQLWQKALGIKDPRLRNIALFFVEQAIWTMSLLNRYRPTGFSQVNQYITGVYYVASQHAECSPWYVLDGKLKRLISTFRHQFAQYGRTVTTTGTAARLGIPCNSIDYIFTDPPFGEKIYYADLNFLAESWHRVYTEPGPEAIVDRARRKDLFDYQRLMEACLKEYYRVLKPGRWMTMVFHNSRNSVWAAIQEALTAAGFVVADVRTLDKQQGSYRQVTSTAVKQDLVISAYKPNGGLEQRFQLEKGTEEGVWDFVRTHLRQLPVFVAQKGKGEAVAERQAYLLYDRMLAFHVQRGILVPLSAAEFYAGLAERFEYRDGMYFLADQVAEYDKKKQAVSEVKQLELIVRDESSAIQWIRQQLLEKPQRFADLQPQFMRETAGWSKDEERLELSEILAQNFLCYDGEGEVPVQIRNYLSKNFHELRGLAKDAPALRAKAKDRWYVPDPKRAVDLEKMRERELLKQFEQYRSPATKKIKVPRLEALRAGFKRAWDQRDYATIVDVAAKIPQNLLEEDPKLLMYYDNALTRLGVG